MHTGVRKTFSSTAEHCTVGCRVVIMKEERGRGSLLGLLGAFFPEEMEGKARVALVCP